MFPNDAISVGIRNETATDLFGQLLLATSTNPDPTRTILSSGSQADTPREVTIYCGSPTLGNNTVFDSMTSAVTSFQIFAPFPCDKAIYADVPRKTFAGVVYVDRDIRLATTTETVTVNVATSTFPAVTAQGFTHGEIVIGFLLFLLVVMAFFGGLLNRIIGIKKARAMYNEYIGGGDTYEGKLVNHDS